MARECGGAANRQYSHLTLYTDSLAVHVSGNSYLTLADARSNRLGISNSSGTVVEKYQYRMFGVTSSSSSVGLEPWFGGMRYLSPKDLYLAEHRLLKPAIGSWTAPDPLGFLDSPNLYGYVAQNPINYIDPSGLTLTQKPKDNAPGETQRRTDATRPAQLGMYLPWPKPDVDKTAVHMQHSFVTRGGGDLFAKVSGGFSNTTGSAKGASLSAEWPMPHHRQLQGTIRREYHGFSFSVDENHYMHFDLKDLGYNISSQDVSFLKGNEGEVLEVYDDQRYWSKKLHKWIHGKGHATVGIGHLLHKGPPTSEEYQWKMTRSEAHELYIYDLQVHTQRLENAVGTRAFSKLTGNQRTALLDYVYQHGSLGGKLTPLVKSAIGTGNWRSVKKALLDDTRYLSRRQREVNLLGQ